MNVKQYVILAAIVIFCLIVGFVIGRFRLRKKKDGTVIIELTEDRQRDRVRFVLDLDLDDIKKKSFLTLEVQNMLNK